MAQPNLNPFSIATACETCPPGRTNNVVNDDTECRLTTVSFPDKTALTNALKTLTAEATIAKYGMIQDWDVSLVKDMSSVFATEGLRKAFNGDLSKWNVSAATNMKNST